MRVGLTSQGFRFIALVGIVGFAAYNNQNNLLYVMCAIGLASFTVSALAGWSSLVGLRVAESTRPEAYAGMPFRERILLASSPRGPGAFGLTLDGAPKPVPFVRSGSHATGTVERLYRRRGRYAGEPIHVSTRFPFGFFKLSRKLKAAREHLVFPPIRPVDTALLDASKGGLLSRARRRGQGDEFFRLRELVPGDHVHHVHWKASAKRGELMVREFGEDESEDVCVAFVNVFTNEEDTSEFEQLVTSAASLVDYLYRAGVRFRFLAAGLEHASSRSEAHPKEILTYLADVRPSETMSTSFVRDAQRAEAEGDIVAVLSLGPTPGVGTLLEPRKLLGIAG